MKNARNVTVAEANINSSITGLRTVLKFYIEIIEEILGNYSFASSSKLPASAP